MSLNDLGWKDAKDAPGDPDWWYQTRYVDESGEPLPSNAFFFGINYRVQYRRKADDVIAREQMTRQRKEAEGAFKFSLLPELATLGPCPKCGATRRKMRFQALDDDSIYGGREVVHCYCKGCRHTRTAKPLDWENPL